MVQLKAEPNQQDILLANEVIEAYCDRDRLTMEECDDLGIDKKAAKVLIDSLGWGKGGLIVASEKQRLSQHFGADFIKTLMGDDVTRQGARALDYRVRWLADHAVENYWRIDFSDDVRIKLLQEIEDCEAYGGQAMVELIQLLDDNNEAIRIAAVKAMGAVWTEHGVNPTDYLVKRFNTWEPIDLPVVIRTLGRMAPNEKIIPHLTKVLENPKILKSPHSWSLRHEAVVALGRCGYKALSAVKHLVAIVKEDPLFQMRREAALALGNIMRDEVMRLQEEKVIFDDEKARSDLTEWTQVHLSSALEDKEAHVREAVSWAYVKLGASSLEVLTHFGIDSDKSQVVRRSAWAIGEIAKRSNQAYSANRFQYQQLALVQEKADVTVSALLNKKQSQPQWVQESIDQAIVSVGVAAPRQSLPVLLGAFTNVSLTHHQKAKSAILAMGQIAYQLRYQMNPNPWHTVKDDIETEVVPLLGQTLQSGDRDLTLSAAASLGNMGDSASQALSNLITALHQWQGDDWKVAAKALAQIGLTAIDPLLASLRHEFRRAERVEEALVEMALMHWDPIIQILHQKLSSFLEDSVVGASLARVFGEIAFRHQSDTVVSHAVDNLIVALKGNYDTYSQAKDYLVRLRDISFEALSHAIGDGDPNIRRRATDTLILYENKTKLKKRLLASLVDDSSVRKRASAARGLGQSGLRSTDVIEALVNRADDPSHLVREEIANQLALMGLDAMSFILVRLDDDEPYLLETLTRALYQAGPDALDYLFEELGHPQRQRRQRAHKALTLMQEEMDPYDYRIRLVKALEDSSQTDRWMAALKNYADLSMKVDLNDDLLISLMLNLPANQMGLVYLVFAKGDSTIIKRLAKIVGDPQQSIESRQKALLVLGEFVGSKKSRRQFANTFRFDVAPALVKALDQDLLREQAYQILKFMGAWATESLVDVIERQPKDHPARVKAIDLLVFYGSRSLEALLFLQDTEVSKSILRQIIANQPEARIKAMKLYGERILGSAFIKDVLDELGPPDQSLLADLMPLLRYPKWRVRLLCLEQIEQMGDKAKSIQSVLASRIELENHPIVKQKLITLTDKLKDNEQHHQQ